MTIKHEPGFAMNSGSILYRMGTGAYPFSPRKNSAPQLDSELVDGRKPKMQRCRTSQKRGEMTERQERLEGRINLHNRAPPCPLTAMPLY